MSTARSSTSTGKRRFPTRTYVFFGLLIALIAGLAWDGSPLGSYLLRKAVAAKFSTVRRVSPAELLAWSRDPNRPPPLLVDFRPPEQWAMSRIDGAVHVDPANPDLSRLRGVSRETPIVVYDGPGVMSAAVVTALAQESFTRVSSLEGGLFRWANEGRPLVDDGGSTEKVHPISFWWGRLLKAKHRP
jgi:rhodanese-related sulfurtransferase